MATQPDKTEKPAKRAYNRKKPKALPLVKPPKRRKGNIKGSRYTPAFVATDEQREQVKTLVACGVVQPIIAMQLNICERTLRDHFRHELDNGLQLANARVGSLLFNDAISGARGARFFWMKCRAGWKEGSSIELTGKDGKPIELRSNDVDLRLLPIEDLELMEAILLKAADKTQAQKAISGPSESD